jgi:putative copper export protein
MSAYSLGVIEVTVQLVHWIVAAAHVLAGAAWFGAMLYSLMVLHPRARSFFRSPGQFEEFIAYLAAGARWKVLGGAAFIALTGVGLLLLPAAGETSTAWYACIAAKVVLFVLAVGLFCFASWKLWPDRVFASPVEIPKYQRRFRIIAFTLLILVGVSTALGVLSSHL